MGSREEAMKAQIDAMLERWELCEEHQIVQGVLGDYYCQLCDCPFTDREING